MTIAVPDVYARSALDLEALRPTLSAPGRVVSVYLDTEARSENAAELTRLRWRALREHLTNSDAPEVALAAIDRLAESAHARGAALVAFAADDGLLHHEMLPDPLDVDTVGLDPAGTGHAGYSSIARVLPLVRSWQAQLPYVAVAIDRLGAQLLAVLPHRPDRELSVEGDDLHVTRSAPGGWSQRRYQQRAENRWEANAGQVAEALTAMVDEHAPRLVVVTGDVRAVQMLRDQVPDRVATLLAEVDGDYGSVAQVLERAAPLIARRVEADTAHLLEVLADRHGRGDRAVTGTTEVLAMLAQARVDTVVMNVSALDGDTACFGPDLTQVAADAGQLRGYGVTDVREGPLPDVIVRAALGGGSGVRICAGKPDDLGGEGVAALLRG